MPQFLTAVSLCVGFAPSRSTATPCMLQSRLLQDSQSDGSSFFLCQLVHEARGRYWFQWSTQTRSLPPHHLCILEYLSPTEGSWINLVIHVPICAISSDWLASWIPQNGGAVSIMCMTSAVLRQQIISYMGIKYHHRSFSFKFRNNLFLINANSRKRDLGGAS